MRRWYRNFQSFLDEKVRILDVIKEWKENGINHLFSSIKTLNISLLVMLLSLDIFLIIHYRHFYEIFFMKDVINSMNSMLSLLISTFILIEYLYKQIQITSLRQEPDIELEVLFKRYYTKLQYFIGSVMNVYDLQRIQVSHF